MTLDEFKADFLRFLEGSNVNLGRKTTKTRQVFLDEATAKFESFSKSCGNIDTNQDKTKKKKKKEKNPLSGSVKCIKPKDPKKGLSVGKGVHAMTPGESMRADEQLDRSPFSGKSDGNE
jgi:hypothetical protein